MNMKTTISLFRLGIVSGLITAALLIGYFVLINELGLLYRLELRVVNIIVLLAGITLTVRYFRRKAGDGSYYFEGLSLCFYTGLLAVGIFAAFVYGYFLMNQAQLESLRAHLPMMGHYLTPLSAALSVVAEGMVAALTIAFVLMQFYKNDHIHNQ